MSPAATAGTSAGGALTVTQTRSAIGTKPKHRGTLRALGLHGIGTSNTLPDRPEIRGMLARVPHLVTVVQSEGAPATEAAKESKPAATAKRAATAKPAAAAKPAATAKPAAAAQAAAAAKSASGTKPTEPAEPAKSAESSESAEPTATESSEETQ
jgi:large subunit ribosomal protein L30